MENKLARVLAVPPYLRAYGATAHGVSTFKDAPQSEDSGESERYSVSRALGSRLKLRKVGLVLAVLILVALVVASSVGYKAWAERDEGSGASGMYAMEVRAWATFVRELCKPCTDCVKEMSAQTIELDMPNRVWSTACGKKCSSSTLRERSTAVW